MSLGSYEQFKNFVKLLTGLDLNCYKPAQMQRRIDQFIHTKGYKTYLTFQETLQAEPQLVGEFLQHLTINVSQFYRDQGQWQILRDQILPELLKGRTFLKVWSAGCSTGQEAYTLATILQEYFPGQNYSILGTDIDHQVLKQAKSGCYKAHELKDIPLSVRGKYYKATVTGFQVIDKLKYHVFFQHHNLLTDPFAAGYDLILCRNVVIYFTEQTKNSLYERFTASLRPGGYLFSGSTEQIFNLQALGLESDAPFFYRKSTKSELHHQAFTPILTHGNS